MKHESKYRNKMKRRKLICRQIGGKAFTKDKDGKDVPFPMPLITD